MAKDLYETLGVSKSADAKQIHTAYRKLARKYHPDVNKDAGAADTFKDVAAAYEVLSDPEKRAQYDRFGPDFRQNANARQGQPPPRTRRRTGASAGGPGGGYTTWTTTSGGAGGVNWEDLFGDAFGPARGSNLTAELTLSLEEAFRGGRRTIQLAEPGGGTTSYEVDIPPGAVDGQQIRIGGAGGAGRGNGLSGDLVITLRIRPSQRYRLSGADIEMDLPVSPWEAALGAEVRVTAPGGPVTITVPAGSSSGRRLRLRGQGMPRPGRPGDIYARVKIMVPTTLSDRERELFEQLRNASTFDPRMSS
ncbi:MAG: molecular chaperone DnaJ [Leifsonia sp.]|nr:molecular chaperone DnaJ [Leifsonia sp.]